MKNGVPQHALVLLYESVYNDTDMSCYADDICFRNSAMKMMRHVESVQYNSDDIPSYFGYS